MTRPFHRMIRLALFVAFILSACGGSGSSGGNFACGSSLNCTSDSQYCLYNASGAGTYSCVNLPSGCAPQAACDGCIGTIANQTACIAIGSAVEVTVSM